jgi:lipooligosaccharide transport system permease protein
MSYNKEVELPSFFRRIFSVWARHFKVYTSHFLSNAFPPFFEPLIFLAGLGIGLGTYVSQVGDHDFTLFLASGLIVSSPMYTAAFECTYGTYIRLYFDKVYDGMLGAPLSPANIMLGELLFVGTKGMFFSFAVLVVVWVFGIITVPLALLTVFVGFLTGIMFGTLALLMTSFVKTLNQFNFFFTGLITPMFFFSGVVFPIENLSPPLRIVAEIIPLTHVVRMSRAFCIPETLGAHLFLDLLYCLVFVLITGYFGIKKISRKLVD